MGILTLSPSRIKTFIRCKKQYHWKYFRHLNRIQKESPLELGSIASEIFQAYYKLEPGERTQGKLVHLTGNLIASHKEEFLGKDPKSERIKEWNKIVKILSLVFSRYKDLGDKFPTISDSEIQILEVETPRTIRLTPELGLLAIPDSKVLFHGEPAIFEHKLRYRYRSGDFGIDYQSIGSCLVTDSMGTIYNVIEYSKQKLHRELIIRTQEELEYFRRILISIGNDILETPEDRMYPQPMKRCSCSYWELCNCEMTGNDVDDVIAELYVTRTKRSPKEDPRDSFKPELYELEL